jgi:hypothetical protein
MTRPPLRTVTAALVAGAALSPAVASAQAPPPSLRVHAIFSGGQAATRFHAGQVVLADVRNAAGRGLTQVCWSPAPIARPACGASGTAAPALPGTTTVTATLDDGTKLTSTLRILAPATRVGGPVAVPATIRCQDVTVFGNFDRRRRRSRDPIETLRRGARVALYNRIAPGKIFMWDYATNRGGFAGEACAQPGAA